MMLNIIAVVAASALMSSSIAQDVKMPIVDLGYNLHQASSLDVAGRYYNFSNIRYAAPPVGSLRFRAPQPPAVDRSTVQTGKAGRICPQANPAWIATATNFIPEYLTGTTSFNESIIATSGPSSVPEQDARTSEDCLFLDVIVPQAVFDGPSTSAGAPVMVWIYGGGFTSGEKASFADPAGLLARSDSGVIFVSLNYRLGAFGWLSGNTFARDGTPNAGLYDQRMALEWIQNNIHLFGGDPARVTIFGESAGGASILHQMTAYGGTDGTVPFSKAILQSPSSDPIVSQKLQENNFDAFLSYLNVTTIEEARALPYSSLQQANVFQVANSSYGTFTYGPAVDGKFVPAFVGQLLATGHYDTSVDVMVGHNANEGILFTYPIINNEAEFSSAITAYYPTLAQYPEVLNTLSTTIYPPIFDGSQAQNYTNQIARAAAVITDLSFSCYNYYVNKAYKNTYAYQFVVAPGVHGQDIPYTFYSGNGSVVDGSLFTGVPYPEVAMTLQEYMTNFAMTGTPNGAGVPIFLPWSSNLSAQVLGSEGISRGLDTAASSRCDWWLKMPWA